MRLPFRTPLHNLRRVFGPVLFGLLCFAFAAGIFAPSHAALAAAGFKQQASNAAGTGFAVISATFTNATVTGNFIAVVVAVNADGAVPTISVSDNNSNTYSQAAGLTSGSVKEEIWYAANISGTSVPVVKATLTGGTGENTLAVHEYSGISASSPLDVWSKGTSNTCPYSSGSTTTKFSTELLIGGHLSNAASGVNFTPDPGWTQRVRKNNPGGMTLETQDQVVSSIGTYQSTGAADNCNSMSNMMATFKVAAGGNQVSSRSDTLSDSRPSATSNHTVAFTVNNAIYGSSISGSSTLVLVFDAPFSSQAGFDCGDVNVATGSKFSFNWPACQATATAWGFSTTGSVVMTLVPPTDSNVHVATGTKMTIWLGSSATSQQQGVHWITNPSSAGVYTISVGGSFGGSGNMLVSINSAVSLQLTVAESLSFSVASVAAASCTADDGATVTAIDTSSISVPFGNLFPANSFFFGCQDLVVSTNAGGGYSLTVQEQTLLQSPGGFSIPQTTCDSGACTLTTAAAWTTPTNNGFGHTCRNQTNHDCAATYSSGSNFRPTANVAAGDAAQTIMSSSTPASATGRIKYRVSSGSSQPAGDYKTIITYTITPTY